MSEQEDIDAEEEGKWQYKTEIDLSWGVRGDNLDPDEITALLGVAPSHLWRRGEEYRHRDGTVGRRPSTVWQLRSEHHVKSTHLNDHAEFILAALEPKAEQIRQIRAKADCSNIRIWYEIHGHNVISFGLRTDLVARLAALAQDFTVSAITMP